MQLNNKSYGTGDLLIILHGPFGSLENWQTLSRVFPKCYRVFAVDQRNHGLSPHHPVIDYSAMAEDLREFMEAQSLSSALLWLATTSAHSLTAKTSHPSHFLTCRPRSFPNF